MLVVISSIFFVYWSRFRTTGLKMAQGAISRQAQQGFTLVEVALAVGILGVGLVTLLTLQSRYIKNVQHEANLFRAALCAQYVMAMIESSGDIPAEGTDEKDLVSALTDYGYFQDQDKQLKEQLRDWRLINSVTGVDFGEIENALRRIDLTVAWGRGDAERFSLVYLLNAGVSRESSSQDR